MPAVEVDTASLKVLSALRPLLPLLPPLPPSSSRPSDREDASAVEPEPEKEQVVVQSTQLIASWHLVQPALHGLQVHGDCEEAVRESDERGAPVAPVWCTVVPSAVPPERIK